MELEHNAEEVATDPLVCPARSNGYDRPMPHFYNDPTMPEAADDKKCYACGAVRTEERTDG
jgi:hypothetical protein